MLYAQLILGVFCVGAGLLALHASRSGQRLPFIGDTGSEGLGYKRERGECSRYGGPDTWPMAVRF